MHVCLKLFCTISNFQKIPAEIILGHEHVFVSIWPANGEAVCAEDLAVKCVWCVCVCERLLWWCFSCVFFLMWQKLQHSQCLASCEVYSDVWPNKRCAPMMVAEIQQCLAQVFCYRLARFDICGSTHWRQKMGPVFLLKCEYSCLIMFIAINLPFLGIVCLAVRSCVVLVSRQTVKAVSACGLGAQVSPSHTLWAGAKRQSLATMALSWHMHFDRLRTIP